jgi:thiol:disulfide interchange protein DsbA
MASFAVDNKIASSRARMLRWGVGGVPTIIVNGKYRFDPTDAGSHEKTIELIDYLIEMERRQRQ